MNGEKNVSVDDQSTMEKVEALYRRILSDTSIRKMLDTVPKALILLNQERQIVYYNSLLKEIFSYKSSLLGKKLGDIFGCTKANICVTGCGTSNFCQSCKAFQSVDQAFDKKINTQRCKVSVNFGNLYGHLDLLVHSSPFVIDKVPYVLFTLEDIQKDTIEKDSERLFSKFFDQVNSAVAIFEVVDDGKDFRFSYFNNAAERIDKIKKEKVLGRRAADVYPGIVSFGLFDVLKNVYQTGEPQEYPLSFYKDDRISGWRENYVLQLPNGQVAAIYDDVSEKKETKEKMEDTKNRLDVIFKSIQTAVLIINPENHVIEDVNPKAEELIGLSRVDIIGEVCHNFICQAEIDNCPVTDYGNRIDCSEKILVNAKREEIPVLKTVKEGFFGGRYHLIETFLDISERKELEQELEFERNQMLSIFDGIDEAIYVADPVTYELLAVNKRMRESFDYDLIGQTCYKTLRGFDTPCEFCMNKIILEDKNSIYRWEYHNPKTDRDYKITNRIIQWPDGRHVRFELAIDITKEKRLEKILEQRSLIDPLTEIGNRRALEEEFKRILKYSKRKKEPFTVILMDIDYFKKYNDTYGHIQGDQCLSLIANCIRKNILKPLDTVFRYGGEEFMALLPATDYEQGKDVAERIRKAVLSLKIKHEASNVHEYVSISSGVYFYDRESTLSIDEIIEKADLNLYKAKDAGRNCIR